MVHELSGDRILLRPWREADLLPFAQMNADPQVMQHMPGLLNRDESAAMVQRIQSHFARHGFGLWAVEVPGAADFVGYVGLSIPSFTAHFTPCVEVGWRLAYRFWGYGYATEAAKVVLACGFGPLELHEIVSFTVPGNIRSRRVMERLGMTHSPQDDFDHPKLPEGHTLRRHVLYRIKGVPFFG